MTGYNAPQDQGYKIVNNYSSKPVQSNSYGRSQSVTVSLPIYQQKQSTGPRRSRCPKGAILGEIGSCCGDKCNRDCARDAD